MNTAFGDAPQVRIGIIGGSGTYHLPGASVLATVHVETPYGAPSGPVTIATVAGRPVAFLPATGAGTRSLPRRSTTGPTSGHSKASVSRR
ncbi:S-methyl-5'-thioadenosine phosphorylase [Arthrobacter sp. Hiyo4]|nr:S-methyl-5'-thioadenosine phosphorylase [Arthrobacter sp. Hiyo4]